MTTALLDPRAAERLCKLLEMLGSNHDGERAAAAWKANEFIRQLGLTWHDVIRIRNETNVSRLPDWPQMARACRMQAHRLTPREFDFINNIAMAEFEPSEKQLKWLRAIYRKFGGDR